MSDNNNDNNIINIPCSASLIKEEIVECIKIYKIQDSLEITVNHKVERNVAYVSKVSKKTLEDISKEIDKRLKELGLNDKQRLSVKNNISNEWKLISGLNDPCVPCDPCVEPKNENICTNIIKSENDEQQEQNSKEGTIIDDDSLEIINPSQALRKDIGHYKVKGTIVSIGKVFRMVLGVHFYCLICKQKQESFFELPMYDIPEYFSPTCQNCNRRETIVGKPIHTNSINIELQNYNTFNHSESLPVFLFDKYTEDIRVGETVEIPGMVNILNIKKRFYTFFYGESIKYLNRENHDLTEEDIRIIKRFKEIHQDKVIIKLVNMFDPSIVEHNVPKKSNFDCCSKYF
jgi:hypothetical protein